jgi:hypothetical protein
MPSPRGLQACLRPLQGTAGRPDPAPVQGDQLQPLGCGALREALGSPPAKMAGTSGASRERERRVGRLAASVYLAWFRLRVVRFVQARA